MLQCEQEIFEKGKMTIVKNAQKGRENEKVDRHH